MAQKCIELTNAEFDSEIMKALLAVTPERSGLLNISLREVPATVRGYLTAAGICHREQEIFESLKRLRESNLLRVYSGPYLGLGENPEYRIIVRKS